LDRNEKDKTRDNKMGNYRIGQESMRNNRTGRESAGQERAGNIKKRIGEDRI